MVYHFREAHPNEEVFVARVSPEMAASLSERSPAAFKYANACRTPIVKMMCPFCEIEKDFP